MSKEDIVQAAALETPIRLELATWPMTDRQETLKVSTLLMDPEIDRAGLQPPQRPEQHMLIFIFGLGDMHGARGPSIGSAHSSQED